jgi:hypothetical protein
MFKQFQISLLSLFIGVTAQATVEELSAQNFSEAMMVVQKKIRQYGPQRVLIAYDLDNTLLAMVPDLGSDSWFEWQTEEVKAGSRFAVADTIENLLALQAQLFSLGTMRLTDASIPPLLKTLKRMGVQQFVLSARGSEMRDVTRREMAKNKIELGDASLPESFQKLQLFDPKHPQKSCLSSEEMQKFKLLSPRPIGIEKDVVYSSGQHKGAILRALLCSRPNSVGAVIFLDDKKKNTDAVAEAYQNHPLNVTTLRYGAEDARVQKFHAEGKLKTHQNWLRLKQTLDTVFKK